MNRVGALAHFFWPWLERRTTEEMSQLQTRKRRDENRIAAISFKRDSEVALEEVRRLADSEAERRRGTEQKAATYLPLVAALIPLILTVVSALWEKKAGGAPVWINMLLLGLAVGYTAAAGWWAFRTLKVGMSHEPGVGDFEMAWGSRNPAAALASQLLLYARWNMEGINQKVDCIMMAHAFLLRAFLTFSLLLIGNIGWYIVGLLPPALEAAAGKPEQAIATAGQAAQLQQYSSQGAVMSMCSDAGHGVIVDIGCFIYDFQTLLTGVVAIIVAVGAGLFAGIPVWRQLKDTNLQTRISHRETLAELLRDALRRYAKVDGLIREPLRAASDATSDPAGEPVAIEAEAAFHVENALQGVLDRYLVTLKDTEHDDIEAKKALLKIALDKATKTLGDAHWADHNDQQDEDRHIPDEEWAEIVARCAEAKVEASDDVSAVWAAYRELQEAQRQWVSSLRARIARLDLEIAAAG